MTSIEQIERLPTKKILQLAVTDSNFTFDVTDTDELLRLRYIYYKVEELPPEERDFLGDFGEFSTYWLRPAESIHELLAEQCVFVEECTKFNLIKISLLILDHRYDVIKYFTNLTPELFCSLLGWSCMNNALVKQLYDNYFGPRTEELILTLESYGFEFVLQQKLLTEFIEYVYSFSRWKEQRALRCVNRLFSQKQLHEVFFYGLPGVNFLEDIDGKVHPIQDCTHVPVERVPTPVYYTQSTLEATAKFLCLKPEAVKAIEEQNISYLQSNSKVIVCSSKLLRVVQYAYVNGKYESLRTLIWSYTNIYKMANSIWKKNSKSVLKALTQYILTSVGSELQHSLLELLP